MCVSTLVYMYIHRSYYSFCFCLFQIFANIFAVVDFAYVTFIFMLFYQLMFTVFHSPLLFIFCDFEIKLKIIYLTNGITVNLHFVFY